MMRWSVAAIVVAAGVATAVAMTATLSEPETNTLTTIDTVPTKIQLDSVFPSGQALTTLSTLAQDDSADTGIRLRAIHALAKYCDPCDGTQPAYQSLDAVIAATRNETSGPRLLVLRAAIETIGTTRVTSAADTISDLLNHPSRDIRAATARALRDLCAIASTTNLRIRYAAETTEQVKLAISEALRIIGQCGATP